MERLLPQNIDAERAALGSILIAGEVGRAVSHVCADDFYAEKHRQTFEAAVSLYERGIPVDLLTLEDEMTRRGTIKEMPDPGSGDWSIVDISMLAHSVPTSANLEYYAKIVARCARLRRLITYAGQLAAIAYADPDAEAAEQWAVDHLMQLTTGKTADSGFVGFGHVLNDVLADVLQRMESPTGIGIKTGLAELDKLIMSIEPGELAFLCGRPGSGKSTVAATIAYNVARDCQAAGTGSVAWVTLEMRNIQQAKRLIAAVSGIRVRVLRAGFRKPNGEVRDDQYDEMMRTWEDMQALDRHLRMKDTGTTLAELRGLLMQEVRQHGCKLLIIDQLSLVDSDKPFKTEQERIAEFSKTLKKIAMALGVPILCLVQLNRETETQGTKNKPMLRNLASSDRLGQDADFVIAVYRGAVYDKERAEVEPMFKKHGELLILKARDSDPDTSVSFCFEGEYTRVSDWPAGWPDMRDSGDATPAKRSA